MNFTYLFLWIMNLTSTYMNCGNIEVCGVLTLEFGNGSGSYSHKNTSVHGLWVQNGNYGSSKCISPLGNITDAIPSVSCYNDYDFQKHEWTKHGICASSSAVDYFQQVCNLSSKPLKIMQEIKDKNLNIQDAYLNLTSQGYEIFSIDEENSQILLSACLDKNNRWKLSHLKTFETDCGNN